MNIKQFYAAEPPFIGKVNNLTTGRIGPKRKRKNKGGGFSWSSYWTTQINAWQGAGSNVYLSGEPEALWQNVYWNTDNNTAATMATIGHGLRQTGQIKSIKIHVRTTGAAPWAIKIFRWSVAEQIYKYIDERAFTPSGTGILDITLSTPLDVQLADTVAIYIPATASVIVGNNSGKQPYLRTVQGENIIADSQLGTNEAYAVDVCLATYGHRPYAVFMGDSIMDSGNGPFPADNSIWLNDRTSAPAGAQSPGNTNGNINFSVPYRFATRMPPNFRYQVFANGGDSTTEAVAAGQQLSRAILADPKAVFIHLGINDLLFDAGAPFNWATISGNLDTIRTGFPAGTMFYLNELLPSSDRTDEADALIRGLNANYATYCTTHGWTLVECHDLMGVIKPSTGELDTLNPLYDCGDTLHLSPAGVDKLAEIMASYLNL